MGFYVLLRWKICLFYTTAKQHTALLCSRCTWLIWCIFDSSFTFLTWRSIPLPPPTPHLWEECRLAPPSRHFLPLTISKRLWSGICRVLCWLFGEPTKQETNWQRPQTPTDPSTLQLSNQENQGHRPSLLSIISVASNRNSQVVNLKRI